MIRSHLALLLAPTLSVVATATESVAPRPNIIFLLADDLGYGDVSCQGQQLFATPNIDRLAAEGLRFTAHYSGSTVCAPSRACLMTGRHTGHASVRGNRAMKPLGQHPLPASDVTVAELLRDAGYQTFAAGKWGLGPPDTEGAPERQGFDRFFGYLCQRNAHRYYPPFLWRDGAKVPLPGNEHDGRGEYAHDLIVDEVLRFLAERDPSRPFLLYAPFTIPHADLDVPADSSAPFQDAFDETPHAKGHYRPVPKPKAEFAGMVARLDRDVGRILDALATAGIDEDTVVIFSSDNGPHREGGADPKFFRSSGPFRGVKRDLYEGGIRVPTFARWPGVIEPGRETDHVSAFWGLPADRGRAGRRRAARRHRRPLVRADAYRRGRPGKARVPLLGVPRAGRQAGGPTRPLQGGPARREEGQRRDRALRPVGGPGRDHRPRRRAPALGRENHRHHAFRADTPPVVAVPGRRGVTRRGILSPMRRLVLLLALPLLAPIARPGCGGFFDAYGSGCAGTGGLTPTLAGVGCPVEGQETTLVIDQHKPGAVAFLVLGMGHFWVPINPFCNIQVSDFYSAPLYPVALSPTGRTEFKAVVPQIAAPEIYLQVVVLDPAAKGGLAASNGLEMNVGL